MRRPALLLAALVALVAADPGESVARSFEIQDFRVPLGVEPDASVWVKEEIDFLFRGAHQGVFRRIPLRARRPGLDHRLRIEDVRATDAEGVVLETEVTGDATALTIKAWVPDARDTTSSTGTRRARNGARPSGGPRHRSSCPPPCPRTRSAPPRTPGPSGP